MQPVSNCNGYGLDYEKVYVDEVQDSTQAEVVLFFLAAGFNVQSLFFAGDPAQVNHILHNLLRSLILFC